MDKKSPFTDEVDEVARAWHEALVKAAEDPNFWDVDDSDFPPSVAEYHKIKCFDPRKGNQTSQSSGENVEEQE